MRSDSILDFGKFYHNFFMTDIVLGFLWDAETSTTFSLISSTHLMAQGILPRASIF